MKPTHIVLLIVFGIAAVVGTNAVFVLKETEKAMVLALGKVVRQVEEPGLKFIVPFYQQVVFFDKRIQETDSAPEEVQSADKKRVVVDSFTRWRIDDTKRFYEAVRTTNTAKDRLNIIVNSNFRKMLAKKDLVDIISGERAGLMKEILDAARVEAATIGIDVVDVRIKRADLPEKNSKAVFSRMQAERQKEAKEIRATGAEEAQKIRAEAEKDRTIVLAEAQRDAQTLRGEGDAQSIKITARSFGKDPNFYSLVRSLEAYEKSLKGEDTLMVLDPSLDFFSHFGSGK